MRPILVALLFLSLSAFAATPYQVVDLKGVSDSTATSTPRFIGTVNGIGLFLATVGNATAIWRTDGTADGTYVLKPIYGASYFGGIVSNGNTAWFSAAEATGWALWRTDGSTTTTITANNSKTIVMLAAIGEKAFFVSASAELWATNGNSVLSLTLLTPVLGSSLSAAVLGNRLYLGTDSGLWKTDGTLNGTTKIAGNPAYALTFANGRLFYGGRSFDSGAELWVSDGNSAGHLVVDYTPGSNSTFDANSVMEGIGDRVVFIAVNGDLVSSDGTESGTSRLSTGPAPNLESTFVSFNGSLYFPYSGGALWRTDGTAAGTSAVADGKIYGLTRTASRLYYIGSNPQHPLALFSHDGTSATFIADVSIAIFAVADDHRLFFAGNDPYHGVEPWVTDGTPAGAHLIANLANDPAGSSRPRQFVAGADRLYFVADGDTGSDLWSTDGSAAGTKSLAHANQSNSLPAMIAALGSSLYLRRGAKLTKIDGNGSEATVQDNATPLDGSVIDGRLYFRAQTSNTTNLFTTDGTSAGTVNLTDYHFVGPMPVIASAGLPFLATGSGIAVAAGPTPQATRAFARVSSSSSVTAQSNLLPVAGAFLLFAEGSSSEVRLWKFSGGAGDATTVKVMPSGRFLADAGAAGFGSTLLFAWRNGAGPIQLWKTDGTAEGTVQIKQFANSFSGNITQFAVLGNRVLFALYDGTTFHPWVSDGTAEGTKSLGAIALTGNADTFRYFIADGLAYFAAASGLWQTDGTVEGTKAIPGVTGVSDGGIARLGNTLYFAATTSQQGTELWALPLPGPGAITIDDVRTSEASGSATVTVRLTQASNQRVTVAYETADGSAKAGHDYTAASGTLAFEAGELAKTITIALANDDAPGNARAFLVKLKDANVAIEKTWGSVAIEDDDNAADLEVIFYPPSGARFDVRNNGPSVASNVIFCSDVRGFNASHRCEQPVELASGETRSYSVSVSGGGTTVSGSVTAWERDPISANNASVWSSTNGTLFVSTGALRPGEQGVAAIHRNSNQSVTFTSSDPAILRFPDNVTTSADQSVIWATFTALAPGTATLRAEYAGFTYGAVVQVTETPHLPVTVTIDSSLAVQLRFGQPSEIAATVGGITTDGVRPSGSVSFFQDGISIGTASLFDQTARLFRRDLQPGAHSYTATYSGDSRFAAGTSQPLNMSVAKGTVSFSAITTDGSNVVIVLRGVDGYVPSGTITVLENGSITRPVGALSPLGSGSASATATGFSSTARTIAISYSGDARYEPANVTIPISGVHRHATRP